MLLRLVRWLPPDLIRLIGAWQFRVPFLRRVVQRFARRLTERTDVIARGIGAGLKFNATGGYPGYLLGTTEPKEQQALAAHLHPGGVFYDIGANIGFYAVIGARMVRPEGQVYAFEPFPESAARIRENAELNALENLRVFTVAVADSEGNARLEVAGKSASHRIYNEPTNDQRRTTNDQHVAPFVRRSSLVVGRSSVPVIETRTVVLDTFIAREGLHPPTVVMIDVEGAEIGVLRGMRDTLQRHRPVIICEVHWINREMNAFFHESLRPLGYSMRALDDNPLPTEPERYHVLLHPGT